MARKKAGVGKKAGIGKKVGVGKKLTVVKKQVKNKPVVSNNSPEKISFNKDYAKKAPTTALPSGWTRPIFNVPLKKLPKSLHPETYISDD